MESLKQIGYVIAVIIMLYFFYRIVASNTTYKRRQRYGVPRYNEKNRSQR